MTSPTNSGINYLAVFVTKIDFEVYPHQERKALSVAFNLQNDLIEGTSKLESTLTAKFNSKDPEESKLFKLEVSVFGLFEEMPNSPLTIRQFAEIQAPALLFPYLREAVTTITSKSPIGPVILPPINVSALLKTGDAVVKGELKNSTVQP